MLGDLGAVQEQLKLVEGLAAGHRSPFVHAHLQRFKGILATRGGEQGAGGRPLQRAAGLFRELSVPFTWL